MVNFDPLAAEIGSLVWGTQAIPTGFAAWLWYCSDVAERKPTKLCTMIGRFLDLYSIYTLAAAFAPLWNFARCKIHLASQSCALLYWQRYCTALE